MDNESDGYDGSSDDSINSQKDQVGVANSNDYRYIGAGFKQKRIRPASNNTDLTASINSDNSQKKKPIGRLTISAEKREFNARLSDVSGRPSENYHRPSDASENRPSTYSIRSHTPQGDGPDKRQDDYWND